MVVWLKHCVGIQETMVHTYNSTKCLAGAFSSLVSISKPTSRALGEHMHWYLHSVQSQGKKYCSQAQKHISWNNHPFTQTLPLQVTPLLFLFQSYHKRKIKPDWKRKYFSEPAAFDK